MSVKTRLTYKRKLLAFSLLMGIAPVLILGVISSLLAAASLQEEVDQHHQSILGHIQQRVDDTLSRINQISLSLASNPTVQNVVDGGFSMDNYANSFQLMELLRSTIGNADNPFDVSLILTKFSSIYSHKLGLLHQIDYPYGEILRQLTSVSATQLTIAPNSFTNQPDMLIVRPIPLNTTSPSGILVLHLFTNEIRELLRQQGVSIKSGILLVDDQHRVIAEGNVNADWKVSDAILPLLNESKPLPDRMKYADKSYIVSSLQSNVNGWTYIAMSPYDELTRKSNQIYKVSFVLVLATVIVWGFTATVGSRRLLNPLQRLVAKSSSKDDKDPNPDTDIIHSLDRYLDAMQVTNEQLQLRLNEQRPVVQEHFLRQLILGDWPPGLTEEDWRTRLAPLRGGWFYVGLVEIDPFAEFKQLYDEQDRALILFGLRKRIEELGESRFPLLLLSPKQGQAVFIVGVEEANEEAERSVHEFGSAIRDRVGAEEPFTVSVLIANPREGYARIHLGYEEALSYQEYRLAMGTNVLITPQRVESSGVQVSNRQLVKETRAIVECISLSEFTEANERLLRLTGEAADALRSTDAILGLFAYFLGELDNFLHKDGVELNNLLGGNALKMLYTTITIQELRDWLGDTVLPAVIGHMQIIPKQKKAVQYTLDAVQAKYDSPDLSLQQLADHLGVSSPTLSKWFKEETGEYFGDYVIRFRMDKAKEWLAETAMPIREIAERLQYTSVQNFTRIFKQMTGVPPGSFRNQKRDGPA